LKPSERDPVLYLEDMVLSMERVQEYIASVNLGQFKLDYKTIDAVVRNFEVIGEASKNLPQVMKDKYPHVPWEQMYRLRNRISHEYFGVDHEIIWDIANLQLATNHKDILEILKIEKSIKG
jgi:uncharacterized protein with HEPN domain